MIFKVSNLRKTFLYFVQGPKFYGAGTPSTPTETTQTLNQNSIPSQLLPYTQTMMGAAENQIYQKDASGAVTGFQPYKPYSTNASDYVAPFSPLQQQAQTGAANLQTPGNFGTASDIAGQAGIGNLDSAGTAAQFGTQGSQMGQNAANVGAAGGLGYGAQSANLGMMAANQAGQGYNAGANFAQQATDPNAVNAYMSPYTQNVMNQQISAANRQYDISGAQEQGAATQAGAFGGSREALMASENERNRNTAIGNIQATGYQNAFTNAQAQQVQAAQLGLQGMNAGNQTIQTGLQGIGQGITGVNTALQGYQQGISGAQAGLEGVSGQQAGYAGAGQAAGTLSNIGTQGLAADTSVLGTQAAAGATQQAQQQQAINQAVLNYQNAQQLPLSDIGMMSDLIRGTPIGNATQTVYQAQPSAISQIGGLAATGIGAYGALNANGGVIEDKGYANGGIVGYAIGGSVEGSMRSKLEALDNPHLQDIINENESPEMTKLAKEVLATNYAKGGIVAFSGENGSSVDDEDTRSPSEIAAANNAIVSASPIVNKGIAAIQNDAPTITPTQEIAPVQEAVTPAVQKGIAPTIDESMVSQQQDIAKLREEAAKPEEQLMAEDKKRRDDALGADTATIEYRKKIMDERANAPDEAKRQMYMRLMEFGANWASTPGAPLVAGMKAIKEGLPGVMADTKANKKAMKDIDASIYALDHADRLEKAGYLDRAAAKKEKASEHLMLAAPQLVDAAIKKETLDEQARHGKRIEDLQGQQNAQQAAYQTATLNKPTVASMGADFIKNAVLPKDQGGLGMSSSEAYLALQKANNPSASGASSYLTAKTSAAKSGLETAVTALTNGAMLDPKSDDYKKLVKQRDLAQKNFNSWEKELSSSLGVPYQLDEPTEVPEETQKQGSGDMSQFYKKK